MVEGGREREREERDVVGVVGSGTSIGDHSWYALCHGKCSVLHPQSRSRPGIPIYLPLKILYTYFFQICCVILRRNQSAVVLIFVDFDVENCSRSTLVTMCGMLPWRGVTRSSWRSLLRPQISPSNSCMVFSKFSIIEFLNS